MCDPDSSTSSPTAPRPLTDYLIGKTLEDALAKGEDEIEIFWPFRQGRGSEGYESVGRGVKRRKVEAEGQVDWRGREAIL